MVRINSCMSELIDHDLIGFLSQGYHPTFYIVSIYFYKTYGFVVLLILSYRKSVADYHMMIVLYLFWYRPHNSVNKRHFYLFVLCVESIRVSQPYLINFSNCSGQAKVKPRFSESESTSEIVQ